MPGQPRLDVVKKMGYSDADVARFLGINTSAVNLLNDPTKARGTSLPRRSIMHTKGPGRLCFILPASWS